MTHAAGPADVDPIAVAGSKRYIAVLVLAAVIGVPISVFAYFFLALVNEMQGWIFTDLPEAIGFDSAPRWWPLLPLGVAGLLVGLCIRHLPGGGGESPADGFQTGRGPAPPSALPGIFLAALAGLALGAVIGPEAPLIALGGGLAAALVKVRKDAPPQAAGVLALTGSFAAVSTLLGSPIVGAVLMLEAVGLGGSMMGLVLAPGLLASGVGYLVFVGLNAWTGLGTFSLAIPTIESVGTVQASWVLWAVPVGVAAAGAVWAIRWLALSLRPVVGRRLVPMTVVAGLAVAGLAILYTAVTDKSEADVLFSGEVALGPLVTNGASYSVGALLLLGLCKLLAYSISLSAFRGGPVFPAMFIGAVGGIALSHLPGLPLVVGVGIGMGATVGAMLRFPIFAVLLTSLFLVDAGVGLLTPIIVAVVVSYAASAWVIPRYLPSREPDGGNAPRIAEPAPVS